MPEDEETPPITNQRIKTQPFEEDLPDASSGEVDDASSIDLSDIEEQQRRLMEQPGRRAGVPILPEPALDAVRAYVK